MLPWIANGKRPSDKPKPSAHSQGVDGGGNARSYGFAIAEVTRALAQEGLSEEDRKLMQADMDAIRTAQVTYEAEARELPTVTVATERGNGGGKVPLYDFAASAADGASTPAKQAVPAT